MTERRLKDDQAEARGAVPLHPSLTSCPTLDPSFTDEMRSFFLIFVLNQWHSADTQTWDSWYVFYSLYFSRIWLRSPPGALEEFTDVHTLILKNLPAFSDCGFVVYGYVTHQDGKSLKPNGREINILDPSVVKHTLFTITLYFYKWNAFNKCKVLV